MSSGVNDLTVDLNEYEALSKDWRDAFGIQQFFDTNLTLGSSVASRAVREQIQLGLAAIAAERLTSAPAPQDAHRAKNLAEVLRTEFDLKTQDGAAAWEDYLTLVGFEYLEQVPVSYGPGLLFGALMGRAEPLHLHTLRCWPYLRCQTARELLARTGYTKHLHARWWAVEPDVLVEGATDLVFVENKPVEPKVPDHGTAAKLGEMLVLGWLAACLGGKRFTLLAMTSREGLVRLKGVRGSMPLRDACARALEAIGLDPHQGAGPSVLACATGFTWPDVLIAMDEAKVALAADADGPSGAFYVDLLARRRSLLAATLERGFRLGSREGWGR